MRGNSITNAKTPQTFDNYSTVNVQLQFLKLN